MAQRKLGRGLGALVTLSPAEADGTARVDEAVGGGSDASVLSLSGRSVEDFFRVVSVEDIVAVRVPQTAAPVADTPVADAADDAEPETMEAPDDDAREVQYTLFDPVIDDGSSVVAERPETEQPTTGLRAPVATADVPAPVPSSASPRAAVDRSDPHPAPLESPAPMPTSASHADQQSVAESVPETVYDDDVVFIDDAVGGLVLPDVEME